MPDGADTFLSDDGDFFGVAVREAGVPDGEGCACPRFRLGAGGTAFCEPDSSRSAVRARERRERLEKDITPRYYVEQFQQGRANVGDC